MSPTSSAERTTAGVPEPGAAIARGPTRWFLLGGGWAAVALGGVGVVVPGLPTTVFFIVAASCFARSSPRFERWVLGLPHVGPLVADHRAGLGMPRRAKVAAVATMLAFAGVSAWLVRDRWWASATIGVVVAAGVAYVTWRVPTRERVLAAQRAVPTT